MQLACFSRLPSRIVHVLTVAVDATGCAPKPQLQNFPESGSAGMHAVQPQRRSSPGEAHTESWEDAHETSKRVLPADVPTPPTASVQLNNRPLCSSITGYQLPPAQRPRTSSTGDGTHASQDPSSLPKNPFARSGLAGSGGNLTGSYLQSSLRHPATSAAVQANAGRVEQPVSQQPVVGAVKAGVEPMCMETAPASEGTV